MVAATGAGTWQPSARQRERDAYRRSRRRRAWLIASVSTAAVVAAVVLVVRQSTGWPRTRDSLFDLRTGWADVPDQLSALWLNVQIMLISEAFVLVVAAMLAFARTL